MHFATRMVLILMMVLATSGVLSAQESGTSTKTSDTAAQPASTETTVTATASDTAATTTAGNSEGHKGNYEVLSQFTTFLSRQPAELRTVLVLSPALLTNEEFLAGHPELARFVAAHPEVALEPSFYLAEFGHLARRSGPLDDLIEPLVAFCGFMLFAYALVWVVRALVEHTRWSRLAKTQSEVHNKILDRFGTSAELLEYVKSPAGSRFLESAPIPLRSEPSARAQSAPLSRVLWSIQFGIVIVAAAIGFLLVSFRYGDEGGDIFALGSIALCIGLGFIASAAITVFLSRRLGIWQSPDASETSDPGFVR